MRFFLAFLFFYSCFALAVINPTADTRTTDTDCISGLMAVGECPNGYEYVPQGLIFSENFDAQPDYMPLTSSDYTTLPQGWDAVYQVENWHPNDIPNAKANMYINDEQPFGENGKSFLNYAESEDGGSGWASDGQIVKDFAPTSAVYFKLKIKFQNGWASDSERGNVKLFRVGHFDGGTRANRFQYFGTGYSAPMYIFNWEQSDYGVRHNHSARCDPQLTNYYCQTPAFTYPHRAVSQGSMSVNYSDNISAFGPSLPDLLNGGLLPTSGTVTHNQVYGDVWHELAFYVELNTAAGVADGKMRYWLDGQKMVSSDSVPWIGTGGDINAKWNFIELGGNDYYHWDVDNDAFATSKERWFVLDELEIYNAVPEGVTL